MRRSPFDLQFASSHLLPLLFIYLGLAHYVACAYWGVVLYRLPPNVADGSTGWQSAVPLDAPGSEYKKTRPGPAAALGAGESPCHHDAPPPPATLPLTAKGRTPSLLSRSQVRLLRVAALGDAAALGRAVEVVFPRELLFDIDAYGPGQRPTAAR